MTEADIKAALCAPFVRGQAVVLRDLAVKRL